MTQDLKILPEGIKLDPLLGVLRKLSWGAADILIAYAKGSQPPFGFSPVLKVDEGCEGPVSAADLAVNKWLIDGLHANFPEAPWEVISEETVQKDLIGGAPVDSEWLWVLDPLDGTKDFLQGTGDYAVHLALLYRNSPIFGIVLIPEKEELWIGVVGLSAWCEKRDGTKISVSFSKRSSISNYILVTSKNHIDNLLEKVIDRLPISGFSSVGSVGCKIATILRGEADFYISLSGTTSPKDWDMAAPHAVLKAAGGLFNHADGLSIKYNKGNLLQSGCLIASNGTNHSSICEMVRAQVQLIEPDYCI